MVKNKKDMRRAMRDKETFSHRSYHGFNHDGKYVLRHWETDIAWVGESGDIVMFDTGYYSNTTSGFQGMIIRHALSDKGRAQLRELLGSNKLRGISLADGQIWDN